MVGMVAMTKVITVSMVFWEADRVSWTIKDSVQL